MACYEAYDILVGPSADAAPLIGSMMGGSAAAPAHGTKKTMPQTQVYNLVGNPAISVPSGFDQEGMPLGVQLAARHFEEATLLRVAHAYQSNTAWRDREPPLPA